MAIKCFATANATSARPAANTLAGAAYARLALDPSLHAEVAIRAALEPIVIAP